MYGDYVEQSKAAAKPASRHGTTRPPAPTRESGPPAPPPPEPPAAAPLPSEFTIATILGDESATVERPIVTDDTERAQLLGYLYGAPTAIFVLARDVDRVKPERGRVVPQGFRTDGTWVWSDALSYYLEQYAIAPETALREHIVGNGYRLPRVPQNVLLAASRVEVTPVR